MFFSVSFVLGVVIMLEVECEVIFIVERWRININKYKKIIEKDWKRFLKFIINIKYWYSMECGVGMIVWDNFIKFL